MDLTYESPEIKNFDGSDGSDAAPSSVGPVIVAVAVAILWFVVWDAPCVPYNPCRGHGPVLA